MKVIENYKRAIENSDEHLLKEAVFVELHLIDRLKHFRSRRLQSRGGLQELATNMNNKEENMNTNKTLKTNNPNEPATDAVTRTAQEILEALQAKDSAKVNSYYAPDAVIATSGRPAAKDGRAVSKAIKDDIADPNFELSLSNEKTEVAGSGDLAYRRGSFKITATNPQTKQAEHSAGTYLTVFRKQADGSWKVVEDFGV
jgi:uncharacterized protein (TIGR02246 family)